jgi:flagellar hook-length control protein FliK
MNLSPADPAGSSTLNETLAAPPATNQPAPSAASFQSLLREADSAEAPPNPIEDSDDAPSQETSSAERSEVDDSAKEALPAEEDAAAAGEIAAGEIAAIGVPIVPIQPLPAIAESEERAEVAESGEELFVASSTAAKPTEATSRVATDGLGPVLAAGRNQEAPAELLSPLESSAVNDVDAAQPTELPVTLDETSEAPATLEAAQALTSDPVRDESDKSGQEHQPSEAKTPLSESAADLHAVKSQPAAAMNLPADAVASTSQPEAADRLPAAQAASAVYPPAASAPTPALPSELAAAPGTRGDVQGQAASVDTVRLLTRVARAFHFAQDGGEVRIRLSPPELGALRMEVRVLEGALVARLETETAAARTAIVENLPALRERLAEQGVRIERFDVDLMQRQAGGSPDRPADRQPPQQLPPSPALRPRRMPQVADGVVARHIIAGEASAGRLNVIV